MIEQKNEEIIEMKSVDSTEVKHINPITDWFIRLLKGALVGIGFILPGLSGGVLAVIFGIYDPLIRFLANIRNKFVKNVMFFLPVAIGAAIGIVLFAIVVEKAFGIYAAQFVCLFVGFVAGTFPSLYKTAGKQGRKSSDLFILIISTIAIFALMMAGGQQLTEVTPNIPMSATPCSTYCGISSSLRKRTSIGKFDATVFNFRSPFVTFIPHSLSNSIEFSLSLPLFCIAILIFSTSFKLMVLLIS